MKKQGAMCQWVENSQNENEWQIRIVYYEYKSVDANTVNKQNYILQKNLAKETWQLLREAASFPEFLGKIISEMNF